jgi:drug/metabolite transporter (DMT)-like permease
MMHAASMVIMGAVMVVLYPESLHVDRSVVLFAVIGGFFFALYHLFVAKAYQLADVSQVYPITTSSPIFVTIWAAIFLGERISLLGVVGILITVAGCLVMNGTSLSKTKLQAGVVAALLAAFTYSFGALFDKLGVNTGNPVMYSFVMNAAMTVFFAIQYAVQRPVEPRTKGEWKWVWIAGVVIVLSTLTYRFGIMHMPISYGVAMRQASGLFGVLMGVFFFHEGYGKMRIIGTLVIIFGIVLLRIGLMQLSI